MKQEEVITVRTSTMKAEEVRAPKALAEFQNVAEVALSTRGVEKLKMAWGSE